MKNLYHLFEAVAANAIYGAPAKKLKVIGVTGTDGKTTTTSLIYHILKHSSKKVSMISTIYAKVGDEEYDVGLHTTTPDSSLIQRLLKKSADSGDEYFVLETTSHALDQYRVWGVQFEIGVITNITHEHLDYHKTYENYVHAKVNLLLCAKTSLINIDDNSYGLLSKILKDFNKKYFTYGYKKQSDFNADIAKKTGLKLASFNTYNYLAAYAVCRMLGLDENVILDAMKTFKLPLGRLETIYDKDFKVMIDFAHTPNSIEVLLKDVKSSSDHKGRLIHVFSSAGERDDSKRPLMGEASGKSADLVILSEEDYRSEDPYAINKAIGEGLEKIGFIQVEQDVFGEKKNTYTFIIDRQEAINKAIKIAKKGDVVVITGKGHEKSLARKGKEYPWSDHEGVKKALRLRNKQ